MRQEKCAKMQTFAAQNGEWQERSGHGAGVGAWRGSWTSIWTQQPAHTLCVNAVPLRLWLWLCSQMATAFPTHPFPLCVCVCCLWEHCMRVSLCVLVFKMKVICQLITQLVVTAAFASVSTACFWPGRSYFIWHFKLLGIWMKSLRRWQPKGVGEKAGVSNYMYMCGWDIRGMGWAHIFSVLICLSVACFTYSHFIARPVTMKASK